MAAETQSLLERISGRLAGTRPSCTRQKSAPQPRSPEEPKCTVTSSKSRSVFEKPRPCVMVTDSSDEEFEKFLTELKTPKSSANKVCNKKNSLKDFIVESDDDDFDSIFSKNGTSSKIKNGKKVSEKSEDSLASLRWDSPVFDSDSDDSIVIKSTLRDRRRKNHNTKHSKSEETNCKENTPNTNHLGGPKAEIWPAGHQSKFASTGSSDEEFECLMDRIKNRTKTQTPCSTTNKIKPKFATEPKLRCFDLTNTKERNPRLATDIHSSPYFSKEKVLKEPDRCVEKTPAAKIMTPCKVEGCFLQDLSCATSTYVKTFKQKKHELTVRLYSLYNQTIFEQELPENLEISWNKKMRKTAGYCVTGQKQPTLERYARIELSEKVCDSADRLRDTLIHELCHAATWLINGVRDGHGQFWKFYARKASLIHPELPMVSRCHSYEINYKFTYECSRCKNTIGRHSKSLDTEKFVCASCKGKLVLQPTNRKDGTPSGNQLTPFAKFVKENYGSAKKEHAGMSHAEVMRKLSADFSTKAKIFS
ncbi:germ cell nuclear acidic protein [Ranitomeya imitator]|uniref:germ cell nuclear acidic protein n=1 Tax=Ranitomeya imitator TaxID=111125 RepID=UPI0037E8C4BF